MLHDPMDAREFPERPICGCSSVVEHLLAKERVESSNLFIRFYKASFLIFNFLLKFFIPIFNLLPFNILVFIRLYFFFYLSYKFGANIFNILGFFFETNSGFKFGTSAGLC